jgi:hypothetical protein
MAEAKRSRAWVAAALPLALLLCIGAGLYLFPSWANTISFVSCVLLLAGSVVTGLCVAVYVLRGWRRGRFPFRRADIMAASLLAALDLLVPSGVVTLVWYIIESLRNSPFII